MHEIRLGKNEADFLRLPGVCDAREDAQSKFLIRFGTLANLAHFKELTAAVRAGGFAPFTVTMAAVARHQLSLLIFGHEVMLVEVRTVGAPPGIILLRLFELHIASSPIRITCDSHAVLSSDYNVQFVRSQ